MRAVRSQQVARTLLLAAFAAVLFLWPFELPIAIGAHGLLHDALGPGYVVGLHATFMVIVASLVIMGGDWTPRALSGDWQWFGLLCAAVLLLGALPLVPSAMQAVDVRYGYYQLLCFVAAVLAVTAVAGLPAQLQRKLWFVFYSGWVAQLLVSLFLLLVSWRAAQLSMPTFAELPLPQRMVMWRFTLGESWNVYGLYMGNANKISNYLVVFLLLSVLLLRGWEPLTRLQRAILMSFWILATFTLIVMFSRAALLLFPFVLVLSGLWSVLRRPGRAVVATAVAAAVIALIAVAPMLLDYLFVAQAFDDSEANPLGTFVDRFEQWNELGRFFELNPQFAWAGMGTSGYGERFFASPEAGTHNTFLDLWVEAGVLAPVLMAGFLGLLVTQILAQTEGRVRTVLLGAIAVMLALMFREHSLAYLFVTSLGGLCFTVIMYLVLANPREARRPLPLPRQARSGA